MIKRKQNSNEKISDIIKRMGNKKLISIEVNPYKPIQFQMLEKIAPNFCSVLWIARQNESKDPKRLEPIKLSRELVRKGYTVLIHIPGIFYSKEKMRSILTVLKDYGVRNIFAMRGGGPWLKIEDCDFPITANFIKFIRDEFYQYFDIMVAGFPHVHPATGSMEDEMYFLRQKIQCGATIVMTQACLSHQRYYNYRQICTKYAIDVPILYGLLMLRSWNDFIRIKRMSCFVDKDVMRSALQAKRAGRGREHGRKYTQNLIRSILNDETSVGIHIFTQNYLELARNILLETNANDFKANLKTRQNIKLRLKC